MENKNLIEVLDRIGRELKDFLKVRIENEQALASGEMYDTIDYEVAQTPDGVTLYLISTEYFKWWDQGTLPHWVPIQPLKDWVEAKVRRGYLPDIPGLPYAVRWKIHEEGTPSHEALKAIADTLIEQHQEELANAIMQDAIDDALGGENLTIDIKI